VAACAAILAAAPHLPQPCHHERRGKKGLLGLKKSPMVYYLNSFQVWIIFV
jgi:hypothetical protein